MSNLVTVAVFTYPSELAVVRGRLESEGIECFVKDELMVQVYNLSSNALGGVKLQVRDTDLDAAREILREAGYETDTFSENRTWITWFGERTESIPWIRKFVPEIRLLLLSAIVIISIALVILPFLVPSTHELLTEKNWCVSHLHYGGKDFVPQSPIEVFSEDYCSDRLNFDNSGTVSFPGFNTWPIKGSWEFDGDQIIVSRTDTFGHIFNGVYSVDINDAELVLQSEKTIIFCFRTRF